MTDIALQTRGLGVKYGSFNALADVDLAIRRNSVHSIIGPNGAGKTTLFHALTGRVRASAGRIELDGQDITTTSDDDRVRLGIARSFQVTSLFPNLTLRENLRLAAQGRTPWQALAPWRRAESNTSALAIADEVISRLELGAVAGRIAGELSHGQQRRLEVAVARYGHPVEEVRREMEANDRAREAYVRHFYRADASSPKHYHLVVDSTAFPVDAVVELVVTAARSRGIGAV